MRKTSAASEGSFCKASPAAAHVIAEAAAQTAQHAEGPRPLEAFLETGLRWCVSFFDFVVRAALVAKPPFAKAPFGDV